MTEPLTIHSARVDDIPILLAQLDRIGVQPFLNECSATHGKGVGLSLGWGTVLWLTHIPSEANHRLNHAEPWAQQRLHTLRGSKGARGPSAGPERRPAGGRAGGLEWRRALVGL